jgi:hypothetical protein
LQLVGRSNTLILSFAWNLNRKFKLKFHTATPSIMFGLPSHPSKSNDQQADGSNPNRIDELMTANLLPKLEDGQNTGNQDSYNNNISAGESDGSLSPLKYNSQVKVKKLPPHLEDLLNKHEPQVKGSYAALNSNNFGSDNYGSSNTSSFTVNKSPHIRKRAAKANDGSSMKSPRSIGSPNRMQRIGSEDDSYYRGRSGSVELAGNHNGPVGILKKRRDSSPELRRLNQKDVDDDTASPGPGLEGSPEHERRARILAARRAALSGVNAQGPAQSIVGMSVSGIAPPVM